MDIVTKVKVTAGNSAYSLWRDYRKFELCLLMEMIIERKNSAMEAATSHMRGPL